MYTFLAQCRDSILHHRLHFFVFFYVFVWSVWLLKVIVAHGYRPYSEEHTPTVSVLIPVAGEEPEHFRKVLLGILAAKPMETMVIINGAQDVRLEQVCRKLQVPYCWLLQPSKRQAIAEAVARTSGEIAVIVDSDTLWDEHTLPELLKPFADSEVGGVTTDQRIFGRDRHVLARFADWMEDIRTQYSMPAMSRFGAVGCLPGRTIAFRRSILVKNMDRFLREKFLGIFVEYSDDRTLTNYTLKDGYKTVYQRTARVWTDTPVTWWRYVKQQYRWAKGSQYNTFRMARYMIRRTPFLAFVYFSDMLIPFFWLGTIVNLVWKLCIGDPVNYTRAVWWQQIIFVTMGLFVSAIIRNYAHLERHPEDWTFLPLFILMQSFLLTPIRVYGFFRLAQDSGWGTRKHAHKGGGQVHVAGVLPYIIGAGLIVFFGVLGPEIETHRQFNSFIGAHIGIIGSTFGLLLILLIITTISRYLLQHARQAATYIVLLMICVSYTSLQSSVLRSDIRVQEERDTAIGQQLRVSTENDSQT